MLRIHIWGRLVLELDDVAIHDTGFSGRQGRLAFIFLVLNRGRRVTRRELATALWSDTPPAAWNNAVSALGSKLRRSIQSPPWPEAIELEGGSGGYQLRAQSDLWIDADAAVSALDQASGFLRQREPRRAWGSAMLAVSLAQRPFLPDEDIPWIRMEQERQHRVLVRALEALGETYLLNDEPDLAIEMANESQGLEPFRESAVRLLMRAHVASGNRAEALRAFESCRQLIAGELGADPSPETTALYLEVLQSASRIGPGTS